MKLILVDGIFIKIYFSGLFDFQYFSFTIIVCIIKQVVLFLQTVMTKTLYLLFKGQSNRLNYCLINLMPSNKLYCRKWHHNNRTSWEELFKDVITHCCHVV
jgi:hypothetical protein